MRLWIEDGDRLVARVAESLFAVLESRRSYSNHRVEEGVWQEGFVARANENVNPLSRKKAEYAQFSLFSVSLLS